MIVHSSKGEKITLADTPFSSGGEGEVRKIVSPAHLTGNCVKIYYVQKRSKQQADKIRFMVDNPPQHVENNGFKIGWPLDIILQNKQFIGFMMPLAFPDSKKLVGLTTPALSKKLDYIWQKYDRKHGKAALVARLKLMNNIAIPVHLLHQTGRYVLQDFKPDNVLITHTGQVTICDMDSIQITNGRNMLFRGTAATAGYAPPEFENTGAGKSPTVPLDKSWDNFAVSVVFYQLLFGLHPYAVTPKKQKDANSSEISTNISDDLFPFGNNMHKIQIVPPLHDKFKILPPQIQDLFKRSFSLNVTNRPSAEEWGRNIHEIIRNAGVIPEIPVRPQYVPPTPQPKPKQTPKIPSPKTEKKNRGGMCSIIVFIIVLSIIFFYCFVFIGVLF
jgi:DNA-binding helix-hairpin-helix protein with protein kinase domain